MQQLKYKRVLYKVSGEVLMGSKDFGYDIDVMKGIAEDVAMVRKTGVEVCLVIGGGNICRGSTMSELGMERAIGDYMGMLGTVMNAIAMQNILDKYANIESRVMSAIQIKPVCDTYIRREALEHIANNKVVIFAAGTGNPFFTTDSGAALRAIEMRCDAILKGTSVDGVYSADPKKNPNAVRYDHISYTDVLKNELKFMDAAAIALARDSKIPVVVFSIKNKKTPLYDVLRGKTSMTIVN